MNQPLRIEVVYALPERQCLLAVTVDAACSALEAVRRSGILDEFPEIDLNGAVLGIWGRVFEDAAAALRDGDRIEIYRPLQIDPKAVRQARAEARATRPRRSRR